MVIYKYKKFFLEIEHVYFAKNYIYSNADIVNYYQSTKNYPNSSSFTTPIIFLKKDIESIERSFRTSTRQEISQVKKTHNIMSNFYFKPQIEIMKKFIKFYNRFAKLRNLPLCDDVKLMKLQNNILITCAEVNKKILVYHTYIFDEERVRLWYSSSNISNNREETSLTIKANKFLHHEDIKYSKKLGFLIYDLGGIISSNKKLEGIQKFKLGFTKETEITNNFAIANSFLGKIALYVKNFKN